MERFDEEEGRVEVRVVAASTSWHLAAGARRDVRAALGVAELFSTDHEGAG